MEMTQQLSRLRVTPELDNRMSMIASSLMVTKRLERRVFQDVVIDRIEGRELMIRSGKQRRVNAESKL